MNGQPLVQTPEATDFFVAATTKIGRKLMLGDYVRNETDPIAYNAIARAHEAIVDGVAKIARLADDPTRTEVMRHDAARHVAEQTAAVLANTQANLIATANRLQTEAYAIVEERFAVDPNRASLQSEIRAWIREQSTKPEGLKAIRDAMNSDREVAAVIYHSQHFLLGLALSVRENMRLDAIEKHLPKTYKMLEQSVALNEQATKYPKAIAKLHRTFYNKAIAAQAARRVEV